MLSRGRGNEHVALNTTDSDSPLTMSFWQQAWLDAQPRLTSIRESIASWPDAAPRILRVGQLDAELLDQELIGVLKEPVNKALGQIKVRGQKARL